MNNFLVKNVLTEYGDIYKRIRLKQFIKDFIIFIKRCDVIVQRVETKIQQVKTRVLQREINKNRCFYQNVQCGVVKNWDLSKSKELVD